MKSKCTHRKCPVREPTPMSLLPSMDEKQLQKKWCYAVKPIAKANFKRVPSIRSFLSSMMWERKSKSFASDMTITGLVSSSLSVNTAWNALNNILSCNRGCMASWSCGDPSIIQGSEDQNIRVSMQSVVCEKRRRQSHRTRTASGESNRRETRSKWKSASAREGGHRSSWK